jgi:hypothetical protein
MPKILEALARLVNFFPAVQVIAVNGGFRRA